MCAPVQRELDLLQKYARKKTRLIETGSGPSTEYIKRGCGADGSLISIDVDDSIKKYKNVEYLIGWSVLYDDLVKPGDKRFKKSKWGGPDKLVVFEGPQHMTGETNLLRKAIKIHNGEVDFFFCDTGEYCGIAEWEIIRHNMIRDSILVLHDIYYPKSVKCFQIAKEVEKSVRWKVLHKTKSKQGMMVARKLV